MVTCKDCRYFIQGEGKSGTCEKRPFVSDRRGGIQKINGEPRKLVLYWAHTICKMFEKGGE